VFAGDTVIRVLTRSGDRVQPPSDDTVAKALKSATSYALVAALTCERNAIDLLRPQSQLSQDDLSRMADQVVAIIVLAYDGEGYLVATFPSGARRSTG
jgi:hypothetical protein